MPIFPICSHMFSFKPLNPLETDGIGHLFKLKHVLDSVAGLGQGQGHGWCISQR